MMSGMLSTMSKEVVEAYRQLLNDVRVSPFFGWFTIAFLSFYTFFVVCLWREPFGIPIICTPVFLLFFFLLYSKLFCHFRKLKFQDANSAVNDCRIWKITLILSIAYTILVLYLKPFESSDTLGQWNQILESKFDDWHPVMHTFSLYLLQKVLRYHHLVVLAFVVLFSHASAWLYVSLRKAGYKNIWCLVTLFLICLSPVTFTLLRVLWKDTAFGIGVLYLSVFQIYLWHGEKLKSGICQWIVFAFLLIYVSFVRHNGFFFTVPLLVFLPWSVLDKNRRMRRLVFSLIVFVGLCSYVGLMTCLKNAGIVSQNKQQMFVESVGVPMCMMSRVMVVKPEEMPSDARDFMLKICSYEDWKNNYDGNFNSVKFSAGDGVASAFKETTPAEFFKLFLKTVKSSKRMCLNALIHISSLGIDPFWQEISYSGTKRFCIRMFDYGFWVRTLLLKPWGFIFLAPGFWVLLLIVAGVYAFLQHGSRVLFMIAPYISYTWGTTLLLTGWDHRFFYGILIGSVPVVLVLLNSHNLTDEEG